MLKDNQLKAGCCREVPGVDGILITEMEDIKDQLCFSMTEETNIECASFFYIREGHGLGFWTRVRF